MRCSINQVNAWSRLLGNKTNRVMAGMRLNYWIFDIKWCFNGLIRCWDSFQVTSEPELLKPSSLKCKMTNWYVESVRWLTFLHYIKFFQHFLWDNILKKKISQVLFDNSFHLKTTIDIQTKHLTRKYWNR